MSVADEITEELVRRLADTDAGRTLLRSVIGAAGEGTEEVVSDLLSPLAEAMVRNESAAELYRQLDPADVLYDYLIGFAVGSLGAGVNIATGRNAEANAELKARDANEAVYLRRMEEIGHLPPESSKNTAREGAAEGTEANPEKAEERDDKTDSWWESKEDGLNDSPAFHTFHDPIRDKMGSAFQSHPKEMKRILKHLEAKGIKIEYRPGSESMSYSPDSVGGKPGHLIMDPEASYSAWLHELTHLADDEASGWQGLKIFSITQRVIEFEEHAYQIEIDFARKNGYSEIARRLERLLFERRQELNGTQKGNKQAQE